MATSDSVAVAAQLPAAAPAQTPSVATPKAAKAPVRKRGTQAAAKSPPVKVATRKAPVKKAAAKKPPVKKAAAKKASVKKASVKKASVKKAAVKKAAPMKTGSMAPLFKALVPPKPKQAVKQKKPKLVRDSFTIPKAEYGVLAEIKQRADKLSRPAKKSELLRAGIKILATLSDAALLTALAQVPTIKTGRPASKK
jgi:hypothetical protein